VSDSDVNPQNGIYIPPTKIFIFFELGQKTTSLEDLPKAVTCLGHGVKMGLKPKK
jgi:hypothetical protein